MTNLKKHDVTFTSVENQIIIGAHRGYSDKYPENTMVAFRAALQEDIDEIELDVQMSRDGVLVLIHDTKLDRTTNGHGHVRDYTFKELQVIDAGSWKGKQFIGERIPAFEEFLCYIKSFPGLLLNVEIKEKTFDTVDKTIGMLNRYSMENRYVITCFDANIIKYAHDRHGVKCQGFPGFLMKNFDEGPEGTYSKMYSIGIGSEFLSNELVNQFSKLGLKIWSYCPDDELSVRRHIAFGSRAIVCNNIEPAIRILNAMDARRQKETV